MNHNDFEDIGSNYIKGSFVIGAAIFVIYAIYKLIIWLYYAIV